jgi:hypothetical protein
VKRPGRILALAAAACLAGYVYAYTSGRAGTPIRSDAFSYFVYLPAWALHHDVSLQAVADDCCGGEFPDWTAIIRWRFTRQWVNAHPIGEAILIAPFFAAAHALTRWTNLSPDGFTFYYQHGAGIAGLCYVLAGLWFLGRLLGRHFPPGVVAATLAALLTGTSLYHYATFDSVWSHAFSFALFSALLERLDARLRQGFGAQAHLDQGGGAQAQGWPPGQLRDDVVLGVICGLIVLVRHTNALIPICFVGAFALRTRRLPIVATVVAAVVVLPQLWLYHRATGHWLISSYGSLGFTWASPHLAGVLVSPQKGLFFYAPLLLAAVAGFFWLPPALRHWRIPFAVLLLANTYLIASWWDWQFGASYGHRGFVDFYPIFAIGLAAAFARVAVTPPLRMTATVAVALLCALSMFQMLQYWHGTLPMSDVTWAQYRGLFLKGW